MLAGKTSWTRFAGSLFFLSHGNELWCLASIHHFRNRKEIGPSQLCETLLGLLLGQTFSKSFASHFRFRYSAPARRALAHLLAFAAKNIKSTACAGEKISAQLVGKSTDWLVPSNDSRYNICMTHLGSLVPSSFLKWWMAPESNNHLKIHSDSKGLYSSFNVKLKDFQKPHF